MDTQSIQTDPKHQTGRVEVELIDDEPRFNIIPESAYDFISADAIKRLPDRGILYHGTLGLRNCISRKALKQLAMQPHLTIYLDVNLRSPWWQLQEVFECLEQACWVKLNENELRQLGFISTDLCEAMHRLQSQFQLEHVIVTQGAKGAIVLGNDGKIHQVKTEPVDRIIDTVGAGDAFSAFYIHGLSRGWSIEEILSSAQQFAAKVIGIRGATTTEKDFYRGFVN